jgi:transcriptional enhancer factor
MNNTINQASAAGSPPGGSKLQVVKLVNDVVNGRKNWKRSKCGAQPIWPPALEAALIEGIFSFLTLLNFILLARLLSAHSLVYLGLQTYVPVDSRETRLLGRFPMRNRYLSDYILRTTGEFRSPKQVGSRLQQLRDPRVGTQGEFLYPLPFGPHWNGETVHELLSHGVPKRVHTRARSMPDDHLHWPYMNRGAGPYSESSSSGMSSPESRTSLDSSLAYPALGGALRPRTRVIIDILPPGSAVPTSTAVLPSANSLTTPDGPFLPSLQPRPILAIDPVVTLLSPSTLHATSFFSVISAGRRSVHTGVSALDLVGPCPTPSPSCSASWEASEQLLYRTRLVPTYWKEICDSPGASFAIVGLFLISQFRIIFGFSHYPHHERSDAVHNSPRRYTVLRPHDIPRQI